MDFPGKNTGVGCLFLLKGMELASPVSLALQVGFFVFFFFTTSTTWKACKYIKLILTNLKGKLHSNAIISMNFNIPLSTMDRSSRWK